MPDVAVSVHVRRPPDVVRRWWTEFPTVYENKDEQPHRIVTLARTADQIDLLTYWRGPLGRELEVPELFTFTPTGWRVDITLPFGLAQQDVFTLTPEADGTRVEIAVDIWCRTRMGRLALAPFKAYARKSYPRTWKAAARWCEAATAGPRP